MRDGRLDEVTLTDADGKAVPGDFNAERTSWSSTERLDYAGRYTWGGKATGTDGQQVPLAGTFGTVTPKKTVRGTLNIGDDRTVGVAAPIRIQFNGHVVRPGRGRAGAVGHHLGARHGAPGAGCPTRAVAPGWTTGPRSTGRPTPR